MTKSVSSSFTACSPFVSNHTPRPPRRLLLPMRFAAWVIHDSSRDSPLSSDTMSHGNIKKSRSTIAWTSGSRRSSAVPVF